MSGTSGEPFPFDYKWVSKLMPPVYDRPNPKKGKRVAHLFVGEWVNIKDDSDPKWVKGRFRGGK